MFVGWLDGDCGVSGLVFLCFNAGDLFPAGELLVSLVPLKGGEEGEGEGG